MFEIYLERSAEKRLRNLSVNILRRIIPHIKSLKDDPKPAECRKIVGAERVYRIRIGDYRVVYEIDEERHRINIMAVGHRKDVYRR
jgi:mRNA interferase RelE/StbE